MLTLGAIASGRTRWILWFADGASVERIVDGWREAVASTTFDDCVCDDSAAAEGGGNCNGCIGSVLNRRLDIF